MNKKLKSNSEEYKRQIDILNNEKNKKEKRKKKILKKKNQK